MKKLILITILIISAFLGKAQEGAIGGTDDFINDLIDTTDINKPNFIALIESYSTSGGDAFPVKPAANYVTKFNSSGDSIISSVIYEQADGKLGIGVSYIGNERLRVNGYIKATNYQVDIASTSPALTLLGRDNGRMITTNTSGILTEQIVNLDTSQIDNTLMVQMIQNHSVGGGTETDPVFSAWNKSTGISITKSQVSDFGTYLTNYTESDPIFTNWDKDYSDLINKPTIPAVSNETYNSTSWNGSTDAADKNSIRDKIESIVLGNADDWGAQVVVSNSTLTGTGTSASPLSVVGVLTDDQTASEISVTVKNGIEQNNVQLELEAIRSDITSGSDDWGTQVVEHNTTLSGYGTAASPLGVIGVLTDDQTASEISVTVQNGIEQNNLQLELEAIRSDITSGGDGWGSDIVVSNSTLYGNGTAASPLCVEIGPVANGVSTSTTGDYVYDFVINLGYMQQSIFDADANNSVDNCDKFDGRYPYYYLDNTDDQDLTLSGTTLSIEDGNSVDLSSIGGGTDDQTIDVLSLSGTTLSMSLENDGESTKTVDLSSIGGDTDDQDLSLSGTTLSIEDGNSVDLSSLQGDGVWNETDTGVDYRSGNVGIGMLANGTFALSVSSGIHGYTNIGAGGYLAANSGLRIGTELSGNIVINSTSDADFNSVSVNGTAVILDDGSIRFPHLTDANAENDSDYFSTTQNARCYKDASGVVHPLY